MAIPQDGKTGEIGKGTASDAAPPTAPGTAPAKIDRDAPAGSKNSLGAESVRDGRPDSDSSVVEAIDEVGPGAVTIP